MNNSKLQAGLHELQETGAFEFIVHRYRADGATCLAISGDDIDMTQIGFALAKHTEAFREATEHFPKARQVSMVGHGRVHYWPDVPYDPAIVAAVRGVILGKMFGGDEDTRQRQRDNSGRPPKSANGR